MPEEVATQKDQKAVEALDPKVEKLIKSIEDMTVLQLSSLIKALEDRWRWW